jgi:hypothetical protein
MRLRELDDRLVPRLASGLRSLLGHVPGVGSRLPAPGPPQPVAVPTRRSAARADPLEEEGAHGGLLGLVRDVPQLAALVVAALFLSVGAFVLDRAGDERVAERLDVPGVADREPLSPSAALGPEVGADVAGYLRRTREDIAALASRDSEGRYIALVLLSDYVAPTALPATLEGRSVGRVYARVPAAGELAEVLEVPTPDEPVAVLQAVYARTATEKREQEAEFRGLAESIEGTAPQDADDKAAYLVDAERVAVEAEAYAAGCACVFAAVVEGTAAALARLLDTPSVRGVEVAGRGTELADLEVRPLWPDQSGVVPSPPPAP